MTGVPLEGTSEGYPFGRPLPQEYEGAKLFPSPICAIEELKSLMRGIMVEGTAGIFGYPTMPDVGFYRPYEYFIRWGIANYTMPPEEEEPLIRLIEKLNFQESILREAQSSAPRSHLSRSRSVGQRSHRQSPSRRPASHPRTRERATNVTGSQRSSP